MLTAHNISCFRGTRELYHDLSFEVNPGEAWVFTGKNGAGKSTLLSALINLFPLSSGEVLWNGKPIHSQLYDFHDQVILLGHKPGLKGRETPTEHLQRWASYQKCSPEGIPEILKSWGIEDPNKELRTYSAGQQKRVTLARLLLEPKKLWLLDEPTSQLDEHGKAILATLVAEHRAQGGAVVACTHEALDWEDCHHVDLDTCIPQSQAA